MPQWIHPIWAFIGIVIFVPFIQARLKIDIKLDKTIDLEYYRTFPFISKIILSVKSSISYAIKGVVLTAALLIPWNLIAKTAGFPIVPLPSVSPINWGELIRLETFWIFASCIVLLLAASNSAKATHLPIWQVFLSYKSQDAELVRSVADRLLGSGIDVWFAEYQIIPETWEQFQSQFEYGLANSAMGIAFTHDGYVQSKYCKQEMGTLLWIARKPVLEIALKPDPLPHDMYPQLTNYPRYDGCDLEGILSFIEGQTGWHIKPFHGNASIPGKREAFETYCLSSPFTIETMGWFLVHKGQIDRLGCISGLTFTRSGTSDSGQLFVNLVCDPETTPEGQRQNQDTDNREMFESLIRFSRQYTQPAEKEKIKEILNSREFSGRIPLQTRLLLNSRLSSLPKYKVRGAHCLWFNGLSHFAMTYYLHPVWKRKYSIILHNKKLDRNAEFVFTFTYKGSFREFCLYGPVMDQFVRSLNWD